jgi:hypothetical protein
MKKNTKKDKMFNAKIDGIIYQGKDGKKRVIENTIVMPMLNTKGEVSGVIQVANGDKQLSFTDQDLDLIRLIASKLANFITDRR